MTYIYSILLTVITAPDWGEPIIMCECILLAPLHTKLSSPAKTKGYGMFKTSVVCSTFSIHIKTDVTIN